MKNVILLILLLVSATFSVSAQLVSQKLDINNVSAQILDRGDMDWDLVSKAQYFVPKDSAKHVSTIFASALWIGGYDNTNLHLAAMTYRQNGSDFFPGPVGNTYPPDTVVTANKWDKVWRVYKSEIDSFNQGLYTTIPPDILNWPANGDISNGESQYLAPFEDVSKSGKYDPTKGDYPLIRGDEALYSIINDTAYRHTETRASAMGIEVHVMPYSYNDTANHLDYTTFYHYVIINKSKNNYHDVLAAMWIDFDIGFPFDDMMGCDTNLNTFYAYNGQDIDSSMLGYYNPHQTFAYYGKNPPAQGAVFLNQKMGGMMYYNNDFSVRGNPTAAIHYYNYLNSKWTNGQPVIACNDGFTGPCTNTTRYMFPGDPATHVGWTWNGSNLPFQDVRGLGSVGPFDLDSGQSICLDVAYVYARGNSGATSSVTELKKQVARVQAFYNRQNYSCETTFAGIKPTKAAISQVKIAPNPTTGNITVSLITDKPGAIQYWLIDMQGRTLNSGTEPGGNSWEIDISSFPTGVYMLKCITADGEWVAKVVKE